MDEKQAGTPISMDKVALWLGWNQININLAKEQIDLLTKENIKLNRLLSTCKCERKEDEKK